MCAPSLFGILFVAYSKLLSCFVDCFSPADLTTRLAYASVSLMQKQKHSKPKHKKKNLRVQKHEVHQTGWDSRVEKKSWKDINKTNAACWRVSNRWSYLTAPPLFLTDRQGRWHDEGERRVRQNRFNVLNWTDVRPARRWSAGMASVNAFFCHWFAETDYKRVQARCQNISDFRDSPLGNVL